jgi:methylphosphotriester-DNA--protein-cysteine methyltransferase
MSETNVTVTGESEFGPFVASKGKFHFHRPDCEWMKAVSPANLIEFSTHREAVESGRKPCKTCRA